MTCFSFSLNILVMDHCEIQYTCSHENNRFNYCSNDYFCLSFTIYLFFYIVFLSMFHVCVFLFFLNFCIISI